MKPFFIIAILVTFGLGFIQAKERNSKPRKVVCYDGSWGNELKSDSVNLNVCTHVNFAFASMRNNTIQVTDPKALTTRVKALRAKYPNLTLLISIGGGSDGCTKYSKMSQNATSRKVFINSVLDFLKLHDLDGLDFDWEFPTFDSEDNGARHLGRLEDKHDFVTILAELKAAFALHQYLLTAALTTAKGNVDRAYDIAQVSHHLDFINLMTYDFHGPWSSRTGHNAPLYPDPHKLEGERILTTQFIVDYFVANKTDPGKIVLGIPLYGYMFQLANASDVQVGARFVKANQGSTYAEICQLLKQPGWHVHWDEHAQVPYAVHGTDWLTFDNLKSIAKKLDFVLHHHLGGAMVWEVNGDDVQGRCGDGKFPLMHLIAKTLNHVEVHA